MQDGWKAVLSIPYVFVLFFPSLEQNFIAYRSSKESDVIFEIHLLWQSGFSGVYSNCCCGYLFEPEIKTKWPEKRRSEGRTELKLEDWLSFFVFQWQPSRVI